MFWADFKKISACTNGLIYVKCFAEAKPYSLKEEQRSYF